MSRANRKIDPRDLPPSTLESIAARFKALSEVNRLRIIIALEPGEQNVTSLVELTRLSQPNLSRHLQTLLDAGILARRKDGLEVFYRISDPTVFRMCDQVCGSLATQQQKLIEASASKRGKR